MQMYNICVPTGEEAPESQAAIHLMPAALPTVGVESLDSCPTMTESRGERVELR